MGLVKVFFWGLLVSFLGSLPLGTTNVAGMQISIQEGVKYAFYFAFGCIVVEVIYVRISLIGINWIRKQKKLFKWMEWISLGIVLALAAGSFWAAMHPHEGARNAMLDNNMHRFVLGMAMCAVNPVQIPFWFGWSTVLFTKKILVAKNSYYNLYIAGIALGTFFGACVFIFGGKYLATKFNTGQSLINWIIGGIFAATAVILLIKILLNKDAAHKLDALPEKPQAGE